MQAVAEAAGVGRATLYRHFPSRETLLCALADAAVTGAGESLQRANLDAVPADEAIARATRAPPGNAEHYAVVSRTGLEVDPEARQRVFIGPLTALVARGERRRAARRPARVAAVRLLDRDGRAHRADVEAVGVEDASSAIVRLFLDGARPRS